MINKSVNADRNIWIFQGNPKEYRVLDALSEQFLEHWRIRQHKEEIKKGDLALIWISGVSAGIYAIAETTSNPGFMHDTPEEAKYHTTEEEKTKTRLMVKLKVIKYLLYNPILRHELMNVLELKNLSILKCARTTNFPVNRDEWDVIQQKIAEHNNK